ncbi:MAG TPA: acyloxyacyl hydrolase [Stellaceae bacterium]|jgi:hypothetical protein|nr:acyloxyacyl hydrolase [Stellaceae bacterium]
MGDRVRLATFAIRALLALLAVAALGASARPAAAQITFGSPNDPAHVALGLGAFDITPSNSHKDAQTAAEGSVEYRFGDVAWIFAPFVGGSVTGNGAFYGYGGFGFDVNFGQNWVLTPDGAAGYFERGTGTKLGSWWEFRTGAEFAYRFSDMSRLGLSVHHTSNAGLTKLNPGEQSAEIVYSVPMH